MDDEAEVATVVRGLAAAFSEREELVAQVDERHVLALPAQLEIEQPAVERQRFLDVADLEGDVVETDGAGFWGVGHAVLP